MKITFGYVKYDAPMDVTCIGGKAVEVFGDGELIGTLERNDDEGSWGFWCNKCMKSQGSLDTGEDKLADAKRWVREHVMSCEGNVNDNVTADAIADALMTEFDFHGDEARAIDGVNCWYRDNPALADGIARGRERIASRC